MKRKPRIFTVPFADIYPLYVEKANKKNRTVAEVDEIILWLTGYDKISLQKQIDDNVDLETFFAEAPQINADAQLIRGIICGYRIEDIEDRCMRHIRYLDKLIDELAKGKDIIRILRR